MNAYEWTDEAGEHRAVLADTGMGREMIRLAGRVKELEQSVARLEATISAVEDELVDDLLPEKDQGLPLPERISWHLLYAKAGNEYGVTFLEARIKELEAESRQRERRVRELEQHHVNLSGLLFNQAATIQRQDVALAEKWRPMRTDALKVDPEPGGSDAVTDVPFVADKVRVWRDGDKIIYLEWYERESDDAF